MANNQPGVLHPLVEWAQRKKLLYLTVEIDSVQDLKVTNDNVHVRGTFGSSKTIYEAILNLHSGVKSEYRKIDNNRHLELVIDKEKEEWWPRLLKEKTKLPWIKVDFNKWKDEDEEEELNGGDIDFPSCMSGLGDMGYDGSTNLDDLGDDDDNSDDEMPELEDVNDDKNNDEPSVTESKIPKGASGDKKDAKVDDVIKGETAPPS